MKAILIYFFFITYKLIAQFHPPQFDSVDFFQRNKIQSVFCHFTSPTSILGEIRFLALDFDKTTKMLNGKSIVLRDTIFKKNGERFNDTIKYYFDEKKRVSEILTVTQYSWGPTRTITKHKYCDNVSNRIDSIIRETDQMIYVTKYIYENSGLKRAFEVAYSKYHFNKDGSKSVPPIIIETNRIQDTTLPYNHYNHLKYKNIDLSRYETNKLETGVINSDLPNNYYLYLYNYTKYKWTDDKGGAHAEVYLYEYLPNGKPKSTTNISLTGYWRGYSITEYYYTE